MTDNGSVSNDGSAHGRTSAIVLAGGKGSRCTGSLFPKQFLQLRGKPILVYVLETYQSLALIDDITLVIHSAYEQLYYDILDTYRLFKVRRVVGGGPTRQASSACGLAATPPCEIVVVQDGVRPFTSAREIVEAVEVARRVGAANVVVPTLDTIVECRDGLIVGVPQRTHLYNGQAPQAFQYASLVEAHCAAAAAGISDATDDAQLVLRLGKAVAAVEGSYANFKITTQEDFLFAAGLLEQQSSAREERW